MRQPPLGQAIAMAIAATALSAAGTTGASASTTMYNTYNAGTLPTSGGTDGWTYGGIGNPTYPTANPGWVGTASPATLPFGYHGASILNWAAEITNAGDSVQISRADAVSRYNVEADIDTGKGAWIDAEAVPQGWAHNTDIGLFKSRVDAYVTLSPSTLNAVIPNFGITVFTGMDTATTLGDGTTPGSGYSHHMGWNSPLQDMPFTNSNPLNTTGVEYVDGLGVGNGGASYSQFVDSAHPFTFLARADQVYSIYLGGSGGAHWNLNKDGYALNITTTPVPVPAAVWLMGSGLLGLFSFGRRKKSGPLS